MRFLLWKQTKKMYIYGLKIMENIEAYFTNKELEKLYGT